MSRLTVTEKEHWKSRIESRINKAIEHLESKDVSLMPTIREKAESEAHRSLGTLDVHTRIEAIQKQRDGLKTEQERLEQAMYRQALGESATRNQAEYYLRNEFNTLLRKSRERIEGELLKESASGREILKLREEKESLLDTVWLATSNAQIRDLWSRVSSVLGDDATPLQQQILSQLSESE